MKNDQPPATAALPTGLPVPGAAPALEVNITAALASVDVMHHGRKVTIMRGQSSTTIEGLLKIGYPAHKILWYRGSMQDWESLGLTTLKPLDK